MNKETILLYVEDEASIREEMVEILELKFTNILVAKNGKEGLEIYKKQNPDLIISDVQMPIMNGLEMSKEIMLLNPQAKIILTTAFNEPGFILAANEIGINQYVNKPVEITKLFQVIDKHLNEGSK